jgi:glyoxylase-like metal-dependent hydrolase (beta-lactamase superfamily II)
MTRGTEPGTTQEIARDVHWLPLRGATVYLVRSAGAWTLVDAGFPGAERTIAAAVGRLCAGDPPESIVLTHGHPDHTGAALALATLWNAPILVPRAELPFVDGTALYPEPLVLWLKRILPRRAMDALTRRSALSVAPLPFDPEDGVPGLPDWTGVPTPGHTPGHAAFFRPGDRTLIAGDAVLAIPWWSRLNGDGPPVLCDLARRRTRLSGPPSGFTCDWPDAAASIAVLAELDPWLLATGHGQPLAGPRTAPALRAFAAQASARPLASPGGGRDGRTESAYDGRRTNHGA